jgi:hypothetical protein
MILLVFIVGVGAAAYYYWPQNQAPLPVPVPTPRTAPTVQAGAEPAVRHPLEAARNEAVPLPTLENSDSMMREALSGLLGRKSFDELVYPSQLIRRIVATVDNLPRETAATRVMPIQPVPGGFAAVRSGEEATISPSNAARYAPYVRVMEAADARALVRRYVQSYSLFQRAYEDLGFPNRYFNDRLVEAIDDLLAAPEVEGPVSIVQPKVVYQFAAPDLETRSAGQKMMIRMGSANAAKVKAKLREVRRELAAAGSSRQ